MAGGTARRRRRTEPANGGPDGRPLSVEEQEEAQRRAMHERGERTEEDKRIAWNETIRSGLLRMVIMMVFFYYRGSQEVKKDTAEVTVTQVTTMETPQAAAQHAAAAGTKERGLLSAFMPAGMGTSEPPPPYYSKVLKNSWATGEPCSLRVFVSESEDMPRAEAVQLGLESAVWAEDGIAFDFGESNSRAKNVTVQVPEGVASGNGSWWVHAFVARREAWRKDAVERSESGDMDMLHAKYNLVKWVKKKTELKGLLGGDSEDGENEEKEEKSKEESTGAEDETSLERDQMWKPAVPIELVAERTNVLLSQLPPGVASEYSVNKEETKYLPPLVVNEFWLIRDVLQMMNETVSEVTLEMTFRPVGLTKWSMFKSIEGMWETQLKMGALRENEPDDLKRMFLETNPVLLGTTVFVSLAHSALEVLAFKSDIAHWKDIKSMEGVSVRSMMWNIVMQFIIFLYLFDNETSWMIVIGNAVGIAIEVWKVRKAVKIKSFGVKKLFGFIPWFELQHDESYSSKTQEYDDEAMRYLSYLIYPCVVGYAIYTLKYEKHKSWYSWVIGSLVGAVYTFGFLMMLPQVIINYRLKSVAHMPMKSFAFKALNTIIDDLFSFIIKMPMLHRVACFRDDVVFLVYLYQMYIYPVDHSRVNEFGQRGIESESAEAKTKSKNGRSSKPKADGSVAAEATTSETTAGASTATGTTTQVGTIDEETTSEAVQEKRKGSREKKND